MTSSTSLITPASSTAAPALPAWASSVPSSIKTTAQAANAALTAKTGQASMGQSDFLKLFTTQLNNQDPTDPVKNEAFVAQLAQFSQLEATTNMNTTLTNYVNSMAGQEATNSANLIGKTVSVPGGLANLTAGTPINGIVNLPTGADGVTMQVYNSAGTLVNTAILGAQTPGNMTFTWNGNDDTGAAVPDGAYSFKATVVSNGVTTNPAVSAMSLVTGITQNPDKSVVLQLQGGKTMNLSDVTNIGS